MAIWLCTHVVTASEERQVMMIPPFIVRILVMKALARTRPYRTPSDRLLALVCLVKTLGMYVSVLALPIWVYAPRTPFCAFYLCWFLK
jgi:hypothetical protein